jgi:hypothetical protein
LADVASAGYCVSVSKNEVKNDIRAKGKIVESLRDGFLILYCHKKARRRIGVTKVLEILT